jgi:hypothetical protein
LKSGHNYHLGTPNERPAHKSTVFCDTIMNITLDKYAFGKCPKEIKRKRRT